MVKHWIHKTKTFELPCHHRLISSTLNTSENRATFGKCMGEFGHGHNYKLKLTFKYIYNQELPFFDRSLYSVVLEKIIKPFAYTSLNDSFLLIGINNPITTGEQITEVFAGILADSEISPYLLEMELVETRRNSFFWSF